MTDPNLDNAKTSRRIAVSQGFMHREAVQMQRFPKGLGERGIHNRHKIICDGSHTNWAEFSRGGDVVDRAEVQAWVIQDERRIQTEGEASRLG